MIRVLHSVSNMSRAGIETFIMNYYRHMDRSKVQFDFWCNKKDPGEYEAEIAQLGGRVFRSPGYSPRKFPQYVSEMKKAVLMEPKINVIHVHNGALGFYALVSARLCGIRARVYHAHSSMIPVGRGRRLKAAIKPLIKYAANYLLTCSDKSGRFYYGDKRMDKGECMLLRNAIEVERFAFSQSTRDALRKQYELSDKVVIAHVGRFTEAKNHLRLLQIFACVKKRVPNAVLLLLGEGELEAQAREKAAQLELSQDVRFMGSRADVSQWYQAFDLFLMPSVWEGLPVVAIEAQTASVPCVLSDAITTEAGITELITFVSLKESDEIWAQKILDALKNAPPRVDRTAQVRNAGYDVAFEARRLQEFYLSIAK